MEDLDDYLEALYEEEMPKKVEATAYIATLARNTETLEVEPGGYCSPCHRVTTRVRNACR